MTRKTVSRLRDAINETAEGMHRLGIMDELTFRKIVASELDAKPSAGKTRTNIRPGAKR